MALRTFASEGFHGSSVRDIARGVGLQPSAVYTHFPSKDHILAEIVRVGHEVHAATLRTALQSAGTDPFDQVRALVRAHTIAHATYPHLAVVVNEEIYALTTELAAPALAVRARSSALLLQIIEQGVAAGQFSPPDIMVTAAAIGALGLRIPYWYEASGGLSVEALADVHVELALRMLGARERTEPSHS